VHVRRGLLGEAQPPEVVVEAPVGVDARLHADLRRAVGERLVHAADELLAVVLVGVRRALGDAEAAERAADDAHVRDVDVAVDDVGHRVAGELRAQGVGRLAHVLDDLGPVVGEQRGQLRRVQRLAGVRAGDRGGAQLAAAAPRHERRVMRADRLQHPR
jgi:hypothetical protein